MSKLHCRGYLAISTIAAASALFVGAPAGASAAAEEPGNGSTSGQTVVDPSASTQPAAPATTEWTPQDAEGGTSSDEAAPLEHGSSVGSGVVTRKAGSDSKAPSYTPDSSGYYEPEPSTPSTFDEPAPSTSQAGSGIDSVQSTATATSASRTADATVGAAISLRHSASPRGGGIGSAPPAAAASLTGSGDRASTSSYALLLLVIIVLGLILGLAGVRLMRHRRRRRLEALWREQAATWEAALRRGGLGQASGASEPSVQRLQRIGVG